MRIRQPGSPLLLWLAALALGAAAPVVCAASAGPRQPPSSAPAAPQPAATSEQPPTYVIGSGDELSIKVFGQPALDDTVVVRPDGRISAVLVGEMQAEGLTPEQMDAALASRYSRYFENPQVAVILRHAAAQRVFVGGEVTQPGVVALTSDLTVLAAVYQVGGFKRSARTDSVMLLRKIRNGPPQVVRLNLKTLGTADDGVLLRPLDVLYVPASRIAKVDSFIDQYVRQLIPISLNAGFTYLLGQYGPGNPR